MGLVIAAAKGCGAVMLSRSQGRRLAPFGDRLLARPGRRSRWPHPALAAVVVLAGSLVAVGVALAAGLALAQLEDTVDRPTFDWMDRHLTRHSTLTRAAQKLTEMGNNRPSQVICVLAGVGLAAWWFTKGRPELRRVWWFPLAAIVTMNVVERFGQTFLARVVDRGHPPPTFGVTLGTYPSGGSARVVCIWGFVAVLVLRTIRTEHRGRVALLLGALVAVAAFIEGYTRTYLLKHWLTDVIGGWLFGGLLLAAFVPAVALATRPLRLTTVRPHDAAQRAPAAGDP